VKAALALLLLPALLAGCLAGKPAPQAVPTGQIDGAVVDALLHPYGNQTVRLVQLGRTDQTSPLGGFTFRNVPPGFYTVTTSLGDVSAAQVVDVEAGRITRVILQLIPTPAPEPYFQAYVYDSPGQSRAAGTECTSCAWAVALSEQRPAEVTLEAFWSEGPILGEERDHLHITVTDDRGFTLYEASDAASPFVASIAGADIHPEAQELRVQVEFGGHYMPSAQPFTMRSVMTLYHGATKAELFGVGA
jgi:hypothetical protein